jgi:hypothetical protein
VRGTELLVSNVIDAKLQRARESRLARLASQPSTERRDPCRQQASPDCAGNLRPVNRPA